MRKEILDHGYLELCEVWGSDEDIIRAARQSTQKGFEGWGLQGYDCPVHGKMGSELAQERGACCEAAKRKDGDEKLLAYLWKNRHSTPFEFAGATFEVQAPLFVFREWHRHRVPFGYSEASARYAPLPDLNYVPEVARMLEVSKANRQAGAAKNAKELNADNARVWRERLEEAYEFLQTVYEEGLVLGVPKEIARAVLPVGRYSKMRATGNLRGWLSFLDLRMALNAQHEIRLYANALHDMLAEKFPRTLKLFDESRKT